MAPNRLIAVVLLLAVVRMDAGTARGAPPNDQVPGTRYLMGPDLKRQLTRTVSMSWTDAPFRQALRGLAQTQQVAIVLDRRVDPDQKITLALGPAPLSEVLAAAAHDRHAEMTQLGAVAYVGPAAAARRLRTLAALRTQEAQRLAADVRKPLLAVRPFAWDDLAMPRELITRLAQEAGVTIEGQERVPHDLWAGQSLPAMSWIDRLTLVAAQYDLTFQFDATGRVVRLAPIPDEVVIQRSYPGGASPAEQARRWRDLAPDARVEVSSGRIVVRGRLEDHERLVGSAKPAAPAPRPGTEVHTLLVQQVPLDKLLAEFEKKLGLRFQWDQDALQKAGISTTANVSVDVKNATLDELLAAALKPAGLSFQREGRVVKIEKR